MSSNTIYRRGLKELLIDDYLDLDEEETSTNLTTKDEDKVRFVPNEKPGQDTLKKIIYHQSYEYVMAVVVFSSSITLGLSLETEEEYKNDKLRQDIIYALDEFFIGLLFVEFCLKIYLEQANYWLNWLNIYDFLVILAAVAEVISTFISDQSVTIRNILKGLRFLQLLRFYRVITLSEGLQVLASALTKTVITYTFSVTMLIFLCIYVVAVIGQILYGKPEQSPWHQFSNSLTISMRLIFVDNWNTLSDELDSQGSPKISRWFFSIVVFIGYYVVTNILVGIMINSVSLANDEYIKQRRQEKILRNQKKREELSKRTKQVLNTHLLDSQNKTENTLDKINTKLKLIHNETIEPSDLSFSIDWLEALVSCSEKNRDEAKSARKLIVHIIESLADIVEENMKRNEKESLARRHIANIND
ncbi:unnamed protein product [Didymodactylos carnosus]|uniref:Ion transport domain-containing protein n=1 Tax=Didymodactylos carnosus TaxID=1234261 RepID=A0A813TSD7_9BILA|nr:unnamed protein product [Didymodactylos carnosus]CAF0813482.1 unnamed protein product [Didymodactylos carnosus]CAF3517749.1 unnamed protein product [Didymodactylos carnosus]CAF3599370.1 unnamed protein product [Didymodactylos carnosus]